MPLARSTAATAPASTLSAKSTVPTTSERLAGSVTKGVAYGEASAQEYSREDESVVRPAHRDHHPGRGLVVRPADQITVRIGDRLRSVPRRGGDHHRVGQERGPCGDGGELRGEFAVAQVQRALPHQAQGSRIPECGGAT